MNIVEKLKEFEGLRLKAYQDVGGKWTIGYGHTGNVHKGMEITREKAEQLLIQDIEVARTAVASLVSSTINQNQRDALTMFVFNFGYGNFKHSTLRSKVLLNPSDPSIEDEFKRWVHVNGEVFSHLVKRRKYEAELYFSKHGEKKKLIFISIAVISLLLLLGN